MRDNGLHEWFLDNYPPDDPTEVWEQIAEMLEMEEDKKTVMMGVKVYDIFSLVTTGEYLGLPVEVPIPCDAQVKRVARASGMVDEEDEGPVMSSWTEVMRRVNGDLGRPVSMLRIDSIAWQSGQIISDCDERRDGSRRRLKEHFSEVGIGATEGGRLAKELTAGLGP